MKYSIVNFFEVRNLIDLRIDSEYWHPDYIENSKKVDATRKIKDFINTNIKNIKSFPISRNFEYLEISKISLQNCSYETSLICNGEEPDRAHFILKKGDIAVSTVRPNRNAVAFIEDNGVIGSSGLAILRAENIEREYLLAFCKTNYFIKCLMRENKSSMYPAVSNNDILDTYLFVPSNIFRSLLVTTVRSSLACLYRSKDVYACAQNLLLSNIALTDWQSEHRLTFVKNYSDTQESNRIDAEYFQPKYEEIMNAIKSYAGGWDTLGSLVTIKKCVEVGSKAYLQEGIPFIRVSNLSPFEITEEKYISEKLYSEIEGHQPDQGEILFSKDATPGIAYYLCEKPRKMIPSSGILRLKNKTDKINNECLTLVLNSILTREQVNRDVGGSVIFHWRLDQVRETAIPVLAKEKQTKIQQKVTESFDLRNQSKHLLESAKRAVEIAIGQDENRAIEWLKEEADSSKR